ncbi:MAG: signal peptidase II [bacterium]|nr:signal peptidase II [bacterium]
MIAASLPPHLKKQLFFYSGLFLLVIVIDQLSKLLVLNYRLFPVYYNKTIAFSLPVAWYLPWLVIAGIGISFLFSEQRKKLTAQDLETFLNHKYLCIALPLIAGGGISNIIDRIFHNGTVVDFIDLRYWPVFNLADSAIVTGVILIIYHLYNKRGA